MKKKICFGFLILLAGVFTACQNQDWEFPDFDYQTVYFAYQYPVRTITLGDDIVDTSLDNEHKFRIMATTGGVYDNKQDVVIEVMVDNSLSEGLLFSAGGNDVITMPTNYYKMSGENIVIPKGSLIGGVEIELTSDFFADPLSLRNTYVIPMRMIKVSNADSILAHKDFTLFAVKYINPWHGFYLRRGRDVIEGKNGNTALNQTVTRRAEYVEWDEVMHVTTQSYTSVELPLAFQNEEGQNIHCPIVLTFDNGGNCTVSAASGNYTATGSGKFVKRGEKNSWGAKDRDALYLNYQIDLDEMHITSTDTLVMRNRGVKMELFSPVLK